MHQRNVGLFILLMLVFGTFACGEEKAPPPPPSPPEINVVEVQKQDVDILVDYVGQTYGAFDISIRARVEGFLEGIHFREGSRVTKGQLLYTIDPQPYEAKVAEAKSRVAEAHTKLVKAESDLNRIRPLAEQNAVSKADLDAAEAQYGAAQASKEAAQASQRLSEIQLSYSIINAPISGIIGKTEAKPGDFVGREPNPVLLNVISRVDLILVQFAVPEADYLRWIKMFRAEKGEPANEDNLEETIDLILADGSIHDHRGKLDFAGREIDPSTGTLLLQASFDNPDRILRPGQYAKVRLRERTVVDGLLIPQRCVMELQGQFSVYVVDSGNKVKKQRVELGETIDDFWLVTSGLTAGDKIVIDALQKVRNDMEINPVVTTFESKSTE
ncbi:MAG: efflux RND transporter periplasmic adaptor subunit [Bacteroidetes bacterium]|nr:MAG: efflux RND transporter periplasmic adaptor subunit [Bacteroidota bacterium]